MRLVDLMPLQEIDFPNQRAFDQYNKIHKLRPDTEVTVAGRKTTAGRAALNSEPVKGTSVFGGKKEKSITDIKMDAKIDVSNISKSLSSNLYVKDINGVINADANEVKKRLDKGQNGVYTRTSPYGGQIKFEDGITFDVYRPYDAHKTKSTKIYASKNNDDIHPRLKDLYKQQFGTEPGQSEEEPFEGGTNVLDRVSDLLPAGSGFTNKSTGDKIIVKGYKDNNMLVSYEKYPNKTLKWPMKQFLKMTANKELQFQPKSK